MKYSQKKIPGKKKKSFAFWSDFHGTNISVTLKLMSSFSMCFLDMQTPCCDGGNKQALPPNATHTCWSRRTRYFTAADISENSN